MNFRAILLVQLLLMSTALCKTAPCCNQDKPITHSSCSPKLLEAEHLLSELGFLPGPIEGCLDDATEVAVLAYRRAFHLDNNEGFTDALLQRLRRSRRLRARTTGDPHVEVDLSTRLIYWVSRDGRVENILPIAVGSGRSFQLAGRRHLAITPRGTFKVYRKIEGWHQSPLGSMYYSSYIIGGVAIHGREDFSSNTTTYGCIAIPTFGAPRFFELMPMDSKVIVFGKSRSKKLH